MLETAAARAVRVVASYACDPLRSRGRAVPEEGSATRSDFQRDRDRILHSTAFRRLKYKTQVFVYHEGDHYRTRLTHTLEVAQIARSLARSLGLDEDLAEAVALAHDLGHPPFGHAGERALQRLTAGIGGFDHNAQSLRVVTQLERRYAAFDGLNLTWETLEGIVKHNGPVAPDDPEATPFLLKWAQEAGADLSTRAPGEAQAAAIADDIAYNSHDIDDGLRAGLFSVDELCAAVPLVARYVEAIRAALPGPAARPPDARDRPPPDHRHGRGRAAGRIRPARGAQARDRRRPARGPGPDPRLLRRHAGRGEGDARLPVRPHVSPRAGDGGDAPGGGPRRADVPRLLERPDDLPEEWREDAHDDPARLTRTVCDYIAGMTDRYAIAEYERLFDARSELR